jgi:hypothetical protein
MKERMGEEVVVRKGDMLSPFAEIVSRMVSQLLQPPREILRCLSRQYAHDEISIPTGLLRRRRDAEA